MESLGVSVLEIEKTTESYRYIQAALHFGA